MPPKKKTNGFMIFTLEWKEKNAKGMSIQQATARCGEIWANMSPQQRGPYNEKAKNSRHLDRDNRDRLTSTGVPVSYIEKEKLEKDQKERSMRKNIEKTVQDSLKNKELATHKYYFIMVNFFAKTLQGGIYLPAEISLSEFSLKEGVTNKFHSYVNPGVTIYGHTYEAQQHSDDTHQLPLPPNAMGEQNLGKLYDQILNFLPRDANGKYPPLYTHNNAILIVESCLDFIRMDTGARDIELDIYSVQYLFFALKEVTAEIGEVPKPASIFVAEACFNRDIFEYHPGLACAYHEQRDKSNYCTLSCVVRWGYTFADYMVNDLAIKTIRGRHVPLNFKEDKPKERPQSSKFSETESSVSIRSESTYVTKAMSEHDVYYDDKSSTFTRQSMFAKNDFPALLGRGKKKSRVENFNEILDRDDEFENNPWASRSIQVPPKPDKSLFDVDLTQADDLTDLNESGDASSSISHGRGRLFRGSLGRGNPYRK